MRFTSPPAAARTRDDRLQLRRLRLAIFAGALAVALVMVLLLWHSQSVVAQTHDLYRFADLGRNVAAGNGLRYTGGPLTIRRAPLYPGFIAVLYLVVGVKPLAIQLCQGVLSAGTCLLVFEIGRRVFSLRTGIVAAVIVGLHPMVLRYVPDIQVETLLTFLYTLTLYRTVRLVEEESALNGFLVGLAAAAAAMVKGVALPYPIVFAFCFLISRRRLRQKGTVLPSGWKPVASMVVGMALVILPWTFRNYEVTGGRFVLISGNASGEFLRGYVFAQPRYYLLRDKPYETGENEADDMQRALFRAQGLVWERDEAETEKVQNIAAKEKLRKNPGAFVKKVAIGFFMFWYVVTTRMNSLVVGSLALLGWAFALVGWIRNRGHGLRFWLVLVPIVSLNLIYAAVLALGRYSAPCIPSLTILAAVGIDSLFRAKSRTERQVSLAAANVGG